MKIRLQTGSIRFRLRQRDVQSLVQNGSATETVRLGIGLLTCKLEVTKAQPEVAWTPRGIEALVPGADVERWAANTEVGIYYTLPEGTRLIVEKDWACMEPAAGESNEDTFPRPENGDA